MGNWRRAPGRRGGRAALLGVTGCLMVAAVSCRDHPSAQPARTPLRIASAFAPLTEPLAAEYQRTLPHLEVKTVRAANSPDVINGIMDNTVDLGVAYSDDIYAAYWNQIAKAGNHPREIRGVALLQPLSEYLLVRGNSGIHQVADLNGKPVGLGPKESSSYRLGELVLDTFGVKPNSVRIFANRADAAAALKDRTVEALFLPGYVYPDDVFWASVKEGAYFIPISGPMVQRLTERNPFVRLTTIPRNVIDGQTSIIPTIGLDMVVVCSLDVSEETIYEATKQLFVAFPRLSSVEASLRFLNFEEASATPIPLHPGAARYFRERELSR